MDKKEFRKIIEQMAVVKDMSLPPGPRAKRVTRIEVDEFGEEIEITEVENQANPTLGFELVKLKDQIALCELGCGDVVTNQLVERRICSGPKPHWRTQCKTCGCYLSPDGEYFVRGAHAIAAEYVKWFNASGYKKKMPKPKEKVVMQPKPPKEANVIEKKGSWIADADGNINYKPNFPEEE